MAKIVIPKGTVASVRLSPVDHAYGISICGEVVRWEPDEPDSGIVTFAVRGATAETVVSLPACAFDGLQVALDGVIEGIFRGRADDRVRGARRVEADFRH